MFQILKCSNGYAKQTCKLRLGQTDLFSGRRRRWEVLNTTNITSLPTIGYSRGGYELWATNTCEHCPLYAGPAAYHLRDLRLPRQFAFRKSHG